MTREARRGAEPKAPGGIGEPWRSMSDDQKEDWRYAVANAPIGVLAAIDRGALAAFIIAQDHLRIANIEQLKLDAKEGAFPLLYTSPKGVTYQSPYVAIMNTATDKMIKAASELGFTPAARPRLASAMQGEVFMPTNIRGGTKSEDAEEDARFEAFLNAERPEDGLEN